MAVEIPEPFRSALLSGHPLAVTNVEATTPEALYGRGMARFQVGRSGEARGDFQAALPALGDTCRIEIAFLDIHERTELKKSLETVEEVLQRVSGESPIRARALHIKGLALGKLRRNQESAEALIQALDSYRGMGDRRRQAEVYDTLGAYYSARGQLESAVGYYAMSLVEKTFLKDRYGTAITLGNLGRLHLRAGRFQEALDCFHLDLQIASEMGDQRGRGRMFNDIGRARMGLGDYEQAIRDLEQCLEVASQNNYQDLKFFAHKDLALALTGQFQIQEGPEELLDRAKMALEKAQDVLGPGVEPYLKFILRAARGELLLASGDKGALEILEQAARDFSEADLPDLEIHILIKLAESYAVQGFPRSADQSLRRALSRARRDGYARYLPVVREAMKKLDLVESAVEETGRFPLSGDEQAAADDAYTNLRLLGEGGFGKVHRALDPRTNRIVAIKRLRLEELYDVTTRKHFLASLQVEMEAASRIRHPGIARVFAIGDIEGHPYLVQEFVEGRSLRDVIRDAESPNPAEVIPHIRDIASSLKALHSCGVIHRDLKPENIILRSGSNQPVLIDFGIAYTPTNPEALGKDVIAGTIIYMAPEQALGKEIDGKLDVYSLGVVCFEWLTGSLPIPVPLKNLNFSILRRQFQEGKFISIRERRPELDAQVAGLVDRMITVEPRRRPDAATVAEDCEWILEQLEENKEKEDEDMELKLESMISNSSTVITESSDTEIINPKRTGNLEKKDPPEPAES